MADCTGGCAATCVTCASLGDCTGGAYMSKPANFTGFDNVSSGGEFNITANDWNDFTDKIIAFALYKSEGNEIDSFTTVSSGDDFRASYFNEVIDGLDTLSSYISKSYPSRKSKGDTIYAEYFTKIKDALNSIG